MLTRTCEFVDNRHTSDPEQLLADFADTSSRSGSLIFRDTSCGVVFGPEHAQLLAGAGFTKADVRAWLVEHCGRTTADLRRVGKAAVGDNGVRYGSGSLDSEGFQRILPDSRHVPVLVAGARNAAMSMVIRVFGVWSGVSVRTERNDDDDRRGRTAGAAVGIAG